MKGEDFNFEIPAGEPVIIKIMGDMNIDNKGYKRSAIDLEEGATLNLYVYGTVEVNSGYGEDASGNVAGKGGYAGIHVPEGATLNLYGTGTLTAIGGNAGAGGNIKVSSNSKIYAYNGNLYTDGTDYENGLNQCPIYLQAGIVTAKYNYNSEYGGPESYKLFELILISNQSITEKSGYKNNKYDSIETSKKYVTKNSVLTNIDMSYQGVGSGAGYTEVSNGTYTSDSSMN